MNTLLIRMMILAVATMAAPAPAPAQDGPETAATRYTVGPDDVLEITVFGKAELTGEVTVDFRGMVQVPLVGEVSAAGRSPAELGEYLAQRYQLVDPGITEVLVSVVEYKSRAVTVVGEVRSPGPYGFVQIPGIWDVILTAGGPEAQADLSQVQIVRANPEPGEPASLTVDLSGGVAAAGAGTLPVLRAQDKLFIPSMEDVPVGGNDFQVLGAVAAPGTYRISMASNIVEAIAASGGARSDADLGAVYLTRSVGGRTHSWKVSIEDYLLAAQTDANLDLLAGDTVTVSERDAFIESFRSVAGLILPILSLAVTFVWASNN